MVVMPESQQRPHEVRDANLNSLPRCRRLARCVAECEKVILGNDGENVGVSGTRGGPGCCRSFEGFVDRCGIVNRVHDNLPDSVTAFALHNSKQERSKSKASFISNRFNDGPLRSRPRDFSDLLRNARTVRWMNSARSCRWFPRRRGRLGAPGSDGFPSSVSGHPRIQVRPRSVRTRRRPRVRQSLAFSCFPRSVRRAVFRRGHTSYGLPIRVH